MKDLKTAPIETLKINAFFYLGYLYAENKDEEFINITNLLDNIHDTAEDSTDPGIALTCALRARGILDELDKKYHSPSNHTRFVDAIGFIEELVGRYTERARSTIQMKGDQ